MVGMDVAARWDLRGQSGSRFPGSPRAAHPGLLSGLRVSRRGRGHAAASLHVGRWTRRRRWRSLSWWCIARLWGARGRPEARDADAGRRIGLARVGSWAAAGHRPQFQARRRTSSANLPSLGDGPRWLASRGHLSFRGCCGPCCWARALPGGHRLTRLGERLVWPGVPPAGHGMAPRGRGARASSQAWFAARAPLRLRVRRGERVPHDGRA